MALPLPTTAHDRARRLSSEGRARGLALHRLKKQVLILSPACRSIGATFSELRGLVLYAHDWDKRAAAGQWALLTVTQTA